MMSRVQQLLSSLVLVFVAVSIDAQQSPSIFVDKFNTSVIYRTNVCDRQRAIWNGSLELPDALRGLNLTVVITNYQYADNDKFFTLRDNKIIPNDPGLFAVIIDEVARRAGFEWRNSFGVADPLNGETDRDKTWTDILLWGVQTFDISVEKWGFSIDRMSKGISFPTGWWDSSVIFAEQFDRSQRKRVVNLWSFLRPFSASVWVGIAASIVLVGLLYWYLEYLDVDADERELETKPLASIFYAGLAFTGHFEFRPNTAAARILGFSFTFWALIVSAAYTANMASFLVSPTIRDFKYSTIQDAIRQDASLCVQKNAVIQSILSEKYPELKLVPVEGEQLIYESLRIDPEDGGCDAAAHQFNVYTVYERNKDVNYDCSIKSEENVVHIVPAGLATVIDTGGSEGAFCTSLISHVLDYHLTEMITDGFIEQAWRYHLNKVGTIECIEERSPGQGADDLDETFSLGMRDMGGIFLLHVICTVVAVLISLVQHFQQAASGEKGKTLAEVFGLAQTREAVNRRMSVSNPFTLSSTELHEGPHFEPKPS